MEHYNDNRRLGDEPLEFPYEKVERLKKERERYLNNFISSLPNFKEVVISDYDGKVGILEARLRDARANLRIIAKILNPATHIAKKLDEHGNIVGILPAALYAIVTPILIGIPSALITSGPRDVYALLTLKRELQNLQAQEGFLEEGAIAETNSSLQEKSSTQDVREDFVKLLYASMNVLKKKVKEFNLDDHYSGPTASPVTL